MTGDLRFDGRVVIVTGAGAGLGRSYALLFGERGAKVVVNDLGGGRHGDGQSTNAADAVVEEIRSRGGTAVADYNSVVDGEKVVQTALENFGRVDVVVNNAGILRDKSFARISDADWSLVHDVHLKGSFKVTQAAWPHFRKQNYGRIIVTSSASGLYGNFGQANYSAAKMGVVGLCNTMAIEGAKYNIYSNVIVPTAASRLTEDILPPDFFAELKPELIAPVVVWLCHEDCQDNGSIIESAAGFATKYSLMRGAGSALRTKISDVVTPESVRSKWDQVTDLSNLSKLDTIQEVSVSLMDQLQAMRDNESSSGSTVEGSSTFSYSERDAIIYALGIGASVTNPSDLQYLYEGHSEFSVFPTYSVIPGQIAVMSSEQVTNAIPGKSFDLSQVLHGEQYIELFKPLPASGTVYNKIRVGDVLDKGKGAIIIMEVETSDENGEKIAYGQMSVFVVGAGGFGGKRSSSLSIDSKEPPSRKPDAKVVEKTSHDQAALYRLSGDLNPMHIDDSFAAIGGFSKPILHGLCSLGFSTRHVLQTFAGNDPSAFKSIKARFVKPVYPGETLMTEMWLEGTRVYFKTSAIESGNTVISGAYVDLNKVSRQSYSKNQQSKL